MPAPGSIPGLSNGHSVHISVPDLSAPGPTRGSISQPVSSALPGHSSSSGRASATGTAAEHKASWMTGETLTAQIWIRIRERRRRTRRMKRVRTLQQNRGTLKVNCLSYIGMWKG